MLPDKAGRIVNIAGFTGSSYVGVRLLTPSGTLGVQGDTDWEQDPNNIALQVRSISISIEMATSDPLSAASLVPDRRCDVEW